eukprot:351742-Chlamydomonas_euryale.AAC.4
MDVQLDRTSPATPALVAQGTKNSPRAGKTLTRRFQDSRDGPQALGPTIDTLYPVSMSASPMLLT